MESMQPFKAEESRHALMWDELQELKVYKVGKVAEKHAQLRAHKGGTGELHAYAAFCMHGLSLEGDTEKQATVITRQPPRGRGT